MLVWDEGPLSPATVLETSTPEQEESVYNLSVDRPHTFLAADFVVHNKGGSSSRSSSRSSSGSSRGSSADEPAQIPDADLFREVAESLRAQMQQWRMDGVTVEYRNICLRKAELILVRNFADPAKDEFTVRISARPENCAQTSRGP